MMGAWPAWMISCSLDHLSPRCIGWMACPGVDKCRNHSERQAKQLGIQSFDVDRHAAP